MKRLPFRKTSVVVLIGAVVAVWLGPQYVDPIVSAIVAWQHQSEVATAE